MKVKSIAVAAALAVGVTGAMAVQVTLTSDTLVVTYDSEFAGLFGAPTLLGNVISWFPSGAPGFAAQTFGGINVANSTFALKVAARPDYYLSTFDLTEGGDYFTLAPRLAWRSAASSA